MASPWNQHCANCIGTLSFPILLIKAEAGCSCPSYSVHTSPLRCRPTVTFPSVEHCPCPVAYSLSVPLIAVD